MTIMDPQKEIIEESEDASELEESNSEENAAGGNERLSCEESDSDSSNFKDDENTATAGNEGWADSIAKILKTNKPKGKKTLVLSRAKKLNEVRMNKPKPVGFEVASEDGQIKKTVLDTEKEEKPPEEPLRKRQKRELPKLRVKPNVLERERERTLGKIATKGVVQLFNAVRGQQKNIDAKLKGAGTLETKREKVLKNIDKQAFLDVLMGEKSVKESVPTTNTSGRSENKHTWSVLRDDFMMGAKLKDWDRELEEENEEETNVEIE